MHEALLLPPTWIFLDVSQSSFIRPADSKQHVQGPSQHTVIFICDYTPWAIAAGRAAWSCCIGCLSWCWRCCTVSCTAVKDLHHAAYCLLPGEARCQGAGHTDQGLQHLDDAVPPLASKLGNCQQQLLNTPYSSRHPRKSCSMRDPG